MRSKRFPGAAFLWNTYAFVRREARWFVKFVCITDLTNSKSSEVCLMRTVAVCVIRYDSYTCLCTLKLTVLRLTNESPFSLLACCASTHARFKVAHPLCVFNKITCAVAGREYQSLLHCRDARQARQYNAAVCSIPRKDLRASAPTANPTNTKQSI